MQESLETAREQIPTADAVPPVECERSDAEQDELNAQLEQVLLDRDELTAQNENLEYTRAQLGVFQQEMDDERSALDEQLEKLSKQQEDLIYAERELEERQQQVQARTQELDGQADDIEMAVDKLKAGFEAVDEERKALRRALRRERKELQERTAQLDSMAENLNQAHDGLEKERKRLDAEQEALEQRRQSKPHQTIAEQIEASCPVSSKLLTMSENGTLPGGAAPTEELSTEALDWVGAGGTRPADNEREYESLDADDPNSIAAYMRRLLARSQEVFDLQEDEFALDEIDFDDITAGSLLLQPAGPLPDSQPRHPQDVSTVRANLDSLRELANLSARTVVARHTWRKLRGTIVVKGTLLAVALAVAAVLFTSDLWGSGSYATFGWSAGFVAAILAVEVLRSAMLIHGMNSARERSKSDAGPSVHDVGTTPEECLAVDQEEVLLANLDATELFRLLDDPDPDTTDGNGDAGAASDSHVQPAETAVSESPGGVR